MLGVFLGHVLLMITIIIVLEGRMIKVGRMQDKRKPISLDLAYLLHLHMLTIYSSRPTSFHQVCAFVNIGN